MVGCKRDRTKFFVVNLHLLRWGKSNYYSHFACRSKVCCQSGGSGCCPDGRASQQCLPAELLYFIAGDSTKSKNSLICWRENPTRGRQRQSAADAFNRNQEGRLSGGGSGRRRHCGGENSEAAVQPDYF